MRVVGMQCCGIREIADIGHMDGPRQVMQELERIFASLPTAHLVFTGVTRGDVNYAANLAEFITENGLGAVVNTPIRVNPNSRNPLQAYLWTPNKRAVKAWWKAHAR